MLVIVRADPFFAGFFVVAFGATADKVTSSCSYSVLVNGKYRNED